MHLVDLLPMWVDRLQLSGSAALMMDYAAQGLNRYLGSGWAASGGYYRGAEVGGSLNSGGIRTPEF